MNNDTQFHSYQTITVRQPKIVLSVLASNKYTRAQEAALRALVSQLRSGARVKLLKKNKHNKDWNEHVREGEENSLWASLVNCVLYWRRQD